MPILAKYRQYCSLLTTSAIKAQLPYPYLSKNAYFGNALFGVSALCNFFNPHAPIFKVVNRPTNMQKLTKPLLYFYVSRAMEGILVPTLVQNLAEFSAKFSYTIFAAPILN